MSRKSFGEHETTNALVKGGAPGDGYALFPGRLTSTVERVTSAVAPCSTRNLSFDIHLRLLFELVAVAFKLVALNLPAVHERTTAIAALHQIAAAPPV
jgi:hypothetical protein